MFKQAVSGTPRLFSTSGTFGEIDLVGCGRGVTLSVTGRNYDTTGRLHCDNVVTNLSTAEARRLRNLLGEAIAAAEDAAVDQPGLWSDATLRYTGVGKSAQ
jgi:hypothetical protein